MALTIQEISEAQNLLDTQGTSAMYSYLSSKGEDYGVLALGVTNNTGWQGQLANGFAEHAARDDSYDMSYDSQEWR